MSPSQRERVERVVLGGPAALRISSPVVPIQPRKLPSPENALSLPLMSARMSAMTEHRLDPTTPTDDAALVAIYGPELPVEGLRGEVSEFARRVTPAADVVAPPATSSGPAPSPVRGFSMETISNAISVVDGNDPDRRAKVDPWVKSLSWALDEMFRIPVINKRVGVDGVLGLIPGVGEGLGLAASFSVVVSALAAGASIPTVMRMVLNIGVDALFGSIPVAGQAWDFFFKSNTRNLKLLNADLDDRESTRRSSIKVLAWASVVFLMLLVVAAAVIALSIFVFVWIIAKIFDN